MLKPTSARSQTIVEDDFINLNKLKLLNKTKNGDLKSNSTHQKHRNSLHGEGSMNFETRAIHVGQRPEKWDMNQLTPPISLAITYKQTGVGEAKGYEYARLGNPTRDSLQENMAAMENAKFCKVFSSGMAVTNAVVNRLRVGDHIIVSEDGYGGTQRYFRLLNERKSYDISFIDTTNIEQVRKALKPTTKLVYFETPTNPLMRISDIAAISRLAHSYNPDILVAVDNTFMTPLFQRPLELGADMVIHSLSKYINGHSDVLMGAVITNRVDLDQHFLDMQITIGAVPSPFDCYLVLRGAKTLAIRMQAHAQSTMAIVKWLEKSDRIERVLYPELESHPQHELHKKQATGMSGMFALYVRGGLKEAEDFLKGLKIFSLGVSLGGYESLACLPAKMTHANVLEKDRLHIGITDNLIRVSVGLENVDDLIWDLKQALERAIPLVDGIEEEEKENQEKLRWQWSKDVGWTKVMQNEKIEL